MDFMFNRCDVVEDSNIASQVYNCAWSTCLFRRIGRSSDMTMLNAVMMKSRSIIPKVFYSHLWSVKFLPSHPTHRSKFEYDDVTCRHDEATVRHIGSLSVEPTCQWENATEHLFDQMQRSVITECNDVTSEDCDRLDLELWPTFWRISALYNLLASKMENN